MKTQHWNAPLSTHGEIENEAIVKRFWNECWNYRNPAIIDEVMSPNMIYHGASMELHGLDDWKKVFNRFFYAFHDTHVSVKDQVAEGDKVVSRVEFEGMHKGKFNDIAPTGRKVKFTILSIHYIIGGLIVEAWEEYDQLGVMQQLGLELKPMEIID